MLATASNILFVVAFILGWLIRDVGAADRAMQSRVSLHLLMGLGTLVAASLVHALVLTYFMGTGRWMEETGRVYRLAEDIRGQNQSLKYKTLPGMGLCLLLLIVTGATGAAADPASPVVFRGWFGVSGGTIHFLLATATFVANGIVNLLEFNSIRQNRELVETMLGEVRRIRTERGLPV